MNQPSHDVALGRPQSERGRMPLGEQRDDTTNQSHVSHAHQTYAAGTPRDASAMRGHAGSKARNVHQAERAASAVVGGTLLLAALNQRSWTGVALALAGGGLLHRGATGHCYAYQALGVNTASHEDQIAERMSRPTATHPYATEVQRSVTIGKSPEELHRFWRDGSNLQQIMAHFADVKAISDTRAHWKLRLPLLRGVEWDTVITEERVGDVIKWQSVEDAAFRNDGMLLFRPAAGNRGTIATLRLRFDLPGGPIARTAAKTMRTVPSTMVFNALRRFKSLVETGEIATTEYDPVGRAQLLTPAKQYTANGLGWFSIALGLTQLIAPRELSRSIGVPENDALMRACGLRELAAGAGILTQKQKAPWLWARVVGDTMDLALLARAYTMRKSDPVKLTVATAAVAGVTVLDLMAAREMSRAHRHPLGYSHGTENRTEPGDNWANVSNDASLGRS